MSCRQTASTKVTQTHTQVTLIHTGNTHTLSVDVSRPQQSDPETVVMSWQLALLRMEFIPSSRLTTPTASWFTVT